MDATAIDTEYDQLIAALYQGPLESPPWHSFLPLFCQHTRAFAVSLVLRPPASGDEGLILNYQRPAQGEANTQLADPKDWPASAYKEHFFALDPFVNLPDGEVFTQAELIPEDELLSSDYYRHYLEPAGIQHILGADTREPDGLQARLRACREIDEAPFDQQEKTLFHLIVPHLRRSIQLHARLNRIESERNLYAGAIDRLSVATILLNEQGTVIDTNPVAAELLAEKDGLELSSQQLLVRSRSQSDEFKQLLASVLDHQLNGEPGLVQAMSIQRPSGKPDLGLVIKPVPTSEWSEGQACPTVAVFISDPERQADTSQPIITRLFGFTRAEATLALLLGQGHSLAEASEKLNVSQHTARAQLKSIFSKTGVTRQAELVRLIVKSVANLG